ncbi:MAG: DUF2807 domain-containing protein [Sphingobacteriales bacterium]|jgi:hypothetical protein|nr:DUF2807 domain-containing protein [Sphingobacteriales bacterium]MBP9140556.1 DUF2807 domain-containing protein [Chitinophagales bacterium]MDA0197264.1 DUF2807 domain-containing protein [Bacteroidota bacterium]MBK6890374.1 DUF2807 domain-containing protein [Sphingobacteriales bacterium]MBK7526572.1 DUF2807 domain-containing protein [Sphingobacteriales bacterium]
MNKQTVFFTNALFLFLLLSLVSACNCEKGSGDVAIDTRLVNNFDKIVVEGNYAAVYLHQDTVSKVTIQTDDNLLPFIETDITTNNQLIISNDKCLKKHKDIVIHVYSPNWHKVQLTGTSDIEAKTSITTDFIEIESTGTGEITLKGLIASNQVDVDLEGTGSIYIFDLETPNLNSDLSGTGVLQYSGNAAYHNIVISGTGNLYAFDLKTNKCDVFHQGTGNCEVYASDALDVTIKSTGDVHYRGNPADVDIVLDGTGEVFDEG